MRWLERPIFVVGCPRSGTTLVQCILSASSRAFSLPETHFLSWALPTCALSPTTRIGVDEVTCIRSALETELKLPDTFWTGLKPEVAIDVFMAVVDYFRPAPDLRVIEKTPRHVLHMDVIG